MKKRSQLTLKPFIELIVIAGIIAAFVYIGASLGSGEYYFKLRSAEEIAILSNTLCGLSGNTEIAFPSDLSKFNVEIENNVVYVYSPQFQKNNDPTAGKHSISKPNCILKVFINRPEKLVIKKEGQQITFINKNAKTI